MRARKKPWAEQEMLTNSNMIQKPEELKGKWHAFFGNNNPIHIEIGCGKGRFANTNAIQNPDVNYIAIEREEQIIVMALKLARENGSPKNIAFITSDAKILGDLFELGEIKRIYINFCDPWHRKKKWFKRRLTHRNFLEMYVPLLNAGEIFFKTDNMPLFEFSLNEFAEMGWKLRNISLDLHKSDYEGNIMTEYEEKFSEMGMPIYRLEASKPND